VSASDLAQLGYCERVVHLDWLHGPKRSQAQVAAQDRGNVAHERFYRKSLEVARASHVKGKCFVATMALGECEETRALRAFRDVYLRRSDVGRWCIGAYYRCSPALCRALETRPAALGVVRAMVKGAARAAATLVNRRLAR
jgi:hypothetical protein